MSKVKDAVVTRPTETITGIGGAGVVYGFLTQAGVSSVVSALVGVAIAFVPAAVSAVVDEIRG
jgi:hypothetical protein